MLRWLLGALLALFVVRFLPRLLRAIAFGQEPRRTERPPGEQEPVAGRPGGPAGRKRGSSIDRSSVIDVPFTDVPAAEPEDASRERSEVKPGR